jgi:hypothetical protein
LRLVRNLTLTGISRDYDPGYVADRFKIPIGALPQFRALEDEATDIAYETAFSSLS